MRYLTGLQSSNAAVFVEPDATATLYADFRYAARGREVEGVTFVETARNLLPEIGELLAGRRVGFEDAHLPYAGYQALVEAGVDAVPTSGLVKSLRAVKDEREIEIMRRAGALSDQIFTALAGERFSGRTERELVWWVERSFRDAGAEGVSFPTVIAAGETATTPHAVPGDQAIEQGALVVVDAGCVVEATAPTAHGLSPWARSRSGSRRPMRSAWKLSSPVWKRSLQACAGGTLTPPRAR